jgi:hypothetical protein
MNRTGTKTTTSDFDKYPSSIEVSGIILRVLWLYVFVYNVYITNQFLSTFTKFVPIWCPRIRPLDTAYRYFFAFGLFVFGCPKLWKLLKLNHFRILKVLRIDWLPLNSAMRQRLNEDSLFFFSSPGRSSFDYHPLSLDLEKPNRTDGLAIATLQTELS